jgi:hypothetical protein
MQMKMRSRMPFNPAQYGQMIPQMGYPVPNIYGSYPMVPVMMPVMMPDKIYPVFRGIASRIRQKSDHSGQVFPH